MLLRVKRLSSRAVLPAYQTEHAAGMDLHAAIDAAAMIEPGGILLVPCGIAVSFPPGHELQVRPRSGLATKFGLSMPNAPGTIDADYRGEVKVPLINLGKMPVVIEPGMRIAQAVLSPISRARIEEVADLDSTARGSGGFGSTGA